MLPFSSDKRFDEQGVFLLPRSNCPDREFLETTADRVVRRRSGRGVCLEDVQAHEWAAYREDLDAELAAGGDPVAFADGRGDVVVWEGNRALSLIRTTPTGMSIRRFDSPLAKPGDLNAPAAAGDGSRHSARFREFMAVVRREEVDSVARPGLTLDEAVTELMPKPDDPAEPDETEDDQEDVAIWEGARVVAVIRDAFGRREVVKLDGKGPPPAPKPVPRVASSVVAPLPFVRQVLTISPPWDLDNPVTVEVVVLSDGDGSGADDAFPGAPVGRSAFPCLSEAGWSGRSTGGLTVFTRIID